MAAIFKPYRSLAPYIQFVGRIMRVIHQNKPDHPDNQGVIVSHVGLNNETRWDDFRELDLDDQNLVREWTAGNNSYQAEDDSSRGGGVPRRFDQLPIVQTEIISAFLHQQFLDPEDDRVLDTILDQTIEPFGIALKTILDRETLREQLRQMQQPPPPTSESIPVSPQRRRREARRRLRERTQSVAARVLDDLGIGPIGRQLSKAAGKGGQPNRQTAIALMHERVNDYIGIDAGMRGELSTGQALDAYEQLDHLGDEIVAKYRPFIDGTG